MKKMLLLGVVIIAVIGAISIGSKDSEQTAVQSQEIPVIALPLVSAKGLPVCDQTQTREFVQHLLQDHPERFQMALTLLRAIRSGLAPDQLGYSGERGVAFYTLPEYGKVALIWGAAVVPTTFGDISPQRVSQLLAEVDQVEPNSKKGIHTLKMVAGCLLQGLPQPQEESERAPAPAPAPAEGAANLLIFLVPGMLLLLVIVTLRSGRERTVYA